MKTTKRFDRLPWPQLLVLKGKDEAQYYLLANVEALHAAALEILRKRATGPYPWIAKPDDQPYGLEDGELTPDQIADLPPAFQKTAKDIVFRNTRRRQEHNDHIAEWAEVQRALAENDGAAAFRILEDRRDHEYEGFELVTLRVPKEIA